MRIWLDKEGSVLSVDIKINIVRSNINKFKPVCQISRRVYEYICEKITYAMDEED